MQFGVNLDLSGVAVYQCADSTGATAIGQNQVQAQGGSSTSFTSFTPSKQNPTFSTDPTVPAAPPAVSASPARCADGTTPVDPTLTTTNVQLWLTTIGDGPVISNCAFDPNGLRGTVPLTTC